jgi:hypothetical protein
MGSKESDGRQSSVTLAIAGRNYTADVWQESPQGWRLLEVRLHGGASRAGPTPSFPGLLEALLRAEELAKELIALEG